MLNIQPFIDAEMERAKAMEELSKILGMDFTFSKDEIRRNYLQAYEKAIAKEINRVVGNLGRS